MSELYVKELTRVRTCADAGCTLHIEYRTDTHPASPSEILSAALELEGAVEVQSPLLSGNWPTLSAPGRYVVIPIPEEEGDR